MKYNAFISYRKISSVNADWIRQNIAGNSEYHLPEGVVGITFQPGDGNQGRYDLAVEKFKEWLQRH